MRALIIDPGPNFSVADVADGWASGLAACGVQVQRFDMGGAMTYHERALRSMGVETTSEGRQAAHAACRDLRQVAYDWWPDVVVVISSFFVSPFTYELLRARGHRIVVVCTESPYEDSNQLKLAPWADIILVNDPQNLDDFRQVNRQSYYVPHAYDPDIHRRRAPREQYQSDVCFVGTGYPSRIAFLERVDWSGLDVALAGNWADLDEASPLRQFITTDDPRVCCGNSDEAIDLYSSTQASFNVYRTEAQTTALSEGWAMGPREVELAACGTFYLTQPRGENRELLPMVPTFGTPEELGDALRFYLRRPELRADIAAQARRAIEGRTFEANASELLARLDQLPTRPPRTANNAHDIRARV